jgi:hypothetical protein
MRAPSRGIRIPKSVWSGSNVCSTPEPDLRRIRSHGFSFLTASGLMSHLKSWNICLENNIILCRIPSHTSHKIQPCDVGVFSPLKTAYREQVERLYRGGAKIVGKQHFTSLYSGARDASVTSRNIKSGWLGAGLRPFNSQRVLKDIQKPPVDYLS